MLGDSLWNREKVKRRNRVRFGDPPFTLSRSLPQLISLWLHCCCGSCYTNAEQFDSLYPKTAEREKKPFWTLCYPDLVGARVSVLLWASQDKLTRFSPLFSPFPRSSSNEKETRKVCVCVCALTPESKILLVCSSRHFFSFFYPRVEIYSVSAFQLAREYFLFGLSLFFSYLVL